jgi:hypothetical protein
MKADQRKHLLDLVMTGLDLEAAATQAGVPVSSIQRDAKLMAEVAAAYRVGSARLRAKLLTLAVEDGDARTLMQLLEQRERAQASLSQSAKRDSGLDAMRAELRRTVERHRRAHEGALRRQFEAELRAAGRLREIEVLPPAPKPKDKPKSWDAVLDEAEVLPPSRALVRRSQAGLSKAIADPGSPWHDGASDCPV